MAQCFTLFERKGSHPSKCILTGSTHFAIKYGSEWFLKTASFHLLMLCIVTSYEPCGLSTTGSSQQTSITLPPIENYGWKKSSGTVSPDWDSDENIKAIEDRVSFLLKGCKCEKTQCANNWCRCFKSNKPCGP